MRLEMKRLFTCREWKVQKKLMYALHHADYKGSHLRLQTGVSVKPHVTLSVILVTKYARKKQSSLGV